MYIITSDDIPRECLLHYVNYQVMVSKSSPLVQSSPVQSIQAHSAVPIVRSLRQLVTEHMNLTNSLLPHS